MDRFIAMKVFTRVVESRSFVKAGESLQLATPQVSRMVQSLEAHLGARLLNRTTRSISLTEDGEAYYERCLRVLAEVDEMEAELTNAKLNPSGKLKVNLPSLLAKTTIIPALPEFFAAYPDIQIEMGLSDRQVDIIEEGVDCVIRTGDLEDSGLVARRIGLLPRVTCAAPAYLEKYGEPETLEDLGEHIAVNYVSSNTGRIRTWDFLVDGKIESIDMRSMIAVNDVDAYVTCGLYGLGILKGALHPLSPYLQSGALRQILKDYPSPPRPVSIMYARNRHLPRKVRLFADWVADVFARSPLTQPVAAARSIEAV
ncbi:LysR family transcriptional regulator [Trinickia caryophylli]|uniref:Transcriptional regulator, LysR family n=1 Tax=Trinickia caryophylli TaxID=28094 RepID=A0A1X7H4T9_TRICW|nr:LysR family transcriptional regulator [Trinickia caryophylli]PMS09613.1 LysR family transcriptional regulator [Trinickia caryophylli]TRX17250.1 LysR family transcriptional regulator [Trinickia caryophylli]WQE12015.1 LysR family transcriptional regulator [Trinickia caryophylli]SMF79776.1 transcriptional regulator, LysR family [Trinickia caryophylli]GLU35592.1 LysR family transcriptional regulator [Trinickia caryophylli]